MSQNLHPNLWDKFFLKIYPRYLYENQLCKSLTTVNVGVLNKLPDIKPVWKIMDFLYLKEESFFRFLGLAGSLHLAGDVQSSYSILEVVTPVVDEGKSFGKKIFPRDIICITALDRQFISAAPESDLHKGYDFPIPE